MADQYVLRDYKFVVSFRSTCNGFPEADLLGNGDFAAFDSLGIVLDRGLDCLILNSRWIDGSSEGSWR